MPHIHSNRPLPAASAITLAFLLACLGLAACGGSSKSSSTAARAATTTSPISTTAGGTGKGAAGANSSRVAALRECLRKRGIALPKGAPGRRRPGEGGSLLGGSGAGQLPKGTTRAQYAAALKKCGGNAFAGGTSRRFNSPAFKAALAKFATCMRENGVNIPAPNTSGKGPIFATKGLNPSSPQFKAAEVKCSGALRGGAGGARGGPPPAGAAG